MAGFQEVVPLKLGELWAVPIMLRLALIENLRRVAAQLNAVRRDRDKAEEWADKVLEMAGKRPSDLIIIVGEMAQSRPVLKLAFVAEFMAPHPGKIAGGETGDRVGLKNGWPKTVLLCSN